MWQKITVISHMTVLDCYQQEVKSHNHRSMSWHYFGGCAALNASEQTLPWHLESKLVFEKLLYPEGFRSLLITFLLIIVKLNGAGLLSINLFTR